MIRGLVVERPETDREAPEQTPGQLVKPFVIDSDGRPDPEWVRGRCPECGDDLVSNFYHTGDDGYLIKWECFASLGENPSCRYFRVL